MNYDGITICTKTPFHLSTRHSPLSPTYRFLPPDDSLLKTMKIA